MYTLQIYMLDKQVQNDVHPLSNYSKNISNKYILRLWAVVVVLVW